MPNIKKGTRGGYRQGARRPLLYGEPIVKLQIGVPQSKVDEFKEFVNEQRAKWAENLNK